MKRKVTQILCLVLSTALLGAVCTGCGEKSAKTVKDMEKEEVPSLSFSIIGGDDVMPIAGFIGPYPGSYAVDGETQPQYISDEYFQMIADCGINFINYNQTDYKQYGNLTFDMLDLAAKYDIGVFVLDAEISGNTGEDALSVHEMGERISNYADYPAFCGIYVADEPQWAGFAAGDGSRDIEVFAPIFNNLAELGVPAYLNLFPSYVNDDEYELYPEYVEEALKNCDVPYLSYDHYIWDRPEKKDKYFFDMSVIREKAEKYNIPFWVYIEAGGNHNDAAERFDTEEYYPNHGQFDWSINTSLAYGAKGIQYFPLLQPVVYAYAESTDWDFERNGIIGAWGNKNRWYYYAQDIQPQIAAVDAVLMNAKSKGVIAAGEQAKKDSKLSTCMMEGTSWRELDDVEGDALIGCFNYRGKTALYVVNYDYEYAQKVTLKLYDKCKFSVVQDAEESAYEGDYITLDMRAGEGALIVFE